MHNDYEVPSRSLVRRVGFVAGVALAWGGVLQAQMSADAVFRGFEPNSDFVFELEGEVLGDAEVFRSERAAAYLVLAPALSSPLLINPRSGSVEAVHVMKVAKRNDGTIDLLADATFDRLDQFRLEGQEVRFSVRGKPAKLKPKPWLLGERDGQELRDDKAEYARRADAYQPRADYVGALRGQGKEVQVRIYFGSWCPACGRLVPRVLSLQDQLQGSKIRFAYYGLPSPLTDDPIAEELDIRGVPTGIVYIAGEEVARLSGNDWNEPEESLLRLLR